MIYTKTLRWQSEPVEKPKGPKNSKMMIMVVIQWMQTSYRSQSITSVTVKGLPNQETCFPTTGSSRGLQMSLPDPCQGHFLGLQTSRGRLWDQHTITKNPLAKCVFMAILHASWLANSQLVQKILRYHSCPSASVSIIWADFWTVCHHVFHNLKNMAWFCWRIFWGRPRISGVSC